MTLLYSDPRFLDHDTGAHPECAARLEAVHARLDSSLPGGVRRVNTWNPATDGQLHAVHNASYVEHLDEFARQGGGQADADTVVCPASVDVARLAAGAVCDAVDRVVGGESSTALCLVRPPGHHARPAQAMGFCLLSNIAVASRYAIDRLELDRVLIVDWDVHHGNGTQEIFYEDAQIGFFSMHRWPFYPGTGAVEETGAGAGRGTTLNLPVEFGVARSDYLTQFTDRLLKFAAGLRPELVLVSAGFDAHASDPIGSLGLETEDFGELTDIVRAVANEHAAGRLVSVLEGGYNPRALADCVALHLDRLSDEPR